MSINFESELHQFRNALLSQGYSPGTIRCYSARLEGFLQYAILQHQDSSQITAVAQEYLDQLACRAKPHTVNGCITAIEHYFVQKYGARHTFKRLLVTAPEPAVLTANEQELLLSAVKSYGSARDRALVALLMFCGLRIGECLSLRLCDVRTETGTMPVVTIRGKAKRTVPLNSFVREALEALVAVRTAAGGQGSSPLFVNRFGRGISPGSLEMRLRNLSHKVGLNVGPADLRRTCLSKLAGTTNDLVLVAQIAGYKYIDSAIKFAQFRCDPAQAMESLLL